VTRPSTSNSSERTIVRISSSFVLYQLISLIASFLICGPATAQQPLLEEIAPQENDLLLRDFQPQSKLVTEQTLKTRAKFSVVDVHTHFHFKVRGNAEMLDDFVDVMDRNNIAVCVSLDGQLGGRFESHKQFLWKKHKDRFAVFVNVNWIGHGDADDPATWDCHRPGFSQRTADQIVAAAAQGASGLKVFKRFGLGYRNPDGTLVKIDDPRWDPIWQACGDAGIPVIIHTADPAAFFDPIDGENERYEELMRHPDWSFHGKDFPSREELLSARNRVIARHRNTNFIGAHVANHSEDLSVVAGWLDQHPNLYIEPASRISELGRQPRAARQFLIRYADRLMFGTDGPWPEQRLRIYWRFFETLDESFDYSEKVPPPQGFWKIYGIDLPNDVLKKLYHENAAKLIPGISERVEKFRTTTNSRLRRNTSDDKDTGS
jgi:predicted TIM-barrel fold metal-dependent hydrolase